MPSLKNLDVLNFRLELQTVVVKDDGYIIPGRYVGRVFTGKGMGTDLDTHQKPVSMSTPDLYIYNRF